MTSVGRRTTWRDETTRPRAAPGRRHSCFCEVQWRIRQTPAGTTRSRRVCLCDGVPAPRTGDVRFKDFSTGFIPPKSLRDRGHGSRPHTWVSGRAFGGSSGTRPVKTEGGAHRVTSPGRAPAPYGCPDRRSSSCWTPVYCTARRRRGPPASATSGNPNASRSNTRERGGRSSRNERLLRRSGGRISPW